MSERPYKIVCISLYHEDLRRLDAKVVELRKLGFTRANRSALIRYALARVKPEEVEDLHPKVGP